MSDKKKDAFFTGNPDNIKKYPVIGVLASGKAPGPVVWESYQFFYALHDAGVTIAGCWHSPLEKGILAFQDLQRGNHFEDQEKTLH